MIDYKSLSLNTGIPLQFAIKEYKMFDLFSKLLSTGWRYPLVGGTAINKIYLHGEERFSEDLDFEMYGKEKIIIPRIDGYTIKGPFVYKRNIRFEAEYSESGKKDKIRIDINMKPKAKVKIVKKTALFLTGNTIANLDTFELECLIARKILAMVMRTDGKDFYDVWHSIPKLDKNRLKKELKWISKLENKKSLLSQALDIINRISIKELSKFNNYIPITRRPDWLLVKRDTARFFEQLK